MLHHPKPMSSHGAKFAILIQYKSTQVQEYKSTKSTRVRVQEQNTKYKIQNKNTKYIQIQIQIQITNYKLQITNTKITNTKNTNTNITNTNIYICDRIQKHNKMHLLAVIQSQHTTQTHFQCPDRHTILLYWCQLSSQIVQSKYAHYKRQG
jgi:hypothetical protein